MDVLIVGGGPTGLTLAIDLLRRGVGVRVIDRLDRPVNASKGKGLQPRSLEVFEDLGLIGPILASGNTYPLLRFHRDGKIVGEMQMTEVRAPSPDIPYPNIYMVPQWKTEQLLTERLAELGGRVERGVELVTLNQEQERVRALLRTSTGDEWVEAAYLVGADGGRSAVREELGIGLEGETPNLPGMIVADVEAAGVDRNYWHFWQSGEDGRVGLCPLPSTEAFQFMGWVAPDARPDLTLETLQAHFDTYASQEKIRLSNMTWASHFRPNIRMARQYRVGRVFLAGDAAHVHPPSGAQGLNTGVQDSYNLGWKLAHVIAGAPDKLLDTYEEERLPIAAHVLGLSNKLLHEGMRSREGLKRGEDERQLLINYEGSSLSPQATIAATLQPGDRLPDSVLSIDGATKRLFDLVHGGSFSVVTNSGATFDNRVTVVDARRLPALADLFGVSRGFTAVVRPDGYVGGIFETPSEAYEYLAQFFAPTSHAA